MSFNSSYPKNCSIDPLIVSTVLGYFSINFIIAFLGAIGNICSLWCLFKCDKINYAAKIQLVIFFGFQFLVCIISLPGFSYVKRLALICRAHEVPMEVKLFFFFCHTLFLPMERMNFAVMAVMRLLAVTWNDGYKKFARVLNILILEFFILAFILIPWIIAFIIKLYAQYPIEDQMTVTFSFAKPIIIKFIYIFHGINHLLPTFISFIAYCWMMYTMLQHKISLFGASNNKNDSSTMMDHVAYTIRLLILVNILLDLPHTLIHLLKVPQVPSLIIHSIFYSHLTFDPVIFVVMNSQYRFFIFNDISSLLKKCRHFSCCKKEYYHRATVVPAEVHLTAINITNKKN